MVELDFRKERECELVFFGLIKDEIGRGTGRRTMPRVLATAWAHPIDRLWLHNCHYDHPKAFTFYQKAGFVPYALWKAGRHEG
ncbi:hypothetical protein E0H70_28255 [Rhizobium leguminosarum bv. viciae]|nr:hypothetical protein E0H70_28255 [Rhizobium leguminosarum bv. viciae]